MEDAKIHGIPVIYTGAIGWSAQSPVGEIWWARGPSGVNLGPFATRSQCELAMKIDIDWCETERDIAPIKALRPVIESDKIWKVFLENESTVYAVVEEESNSLTYHDNYQEAEDFLMERKRSIFDK